MPKEPTKAQRSFLFKASQASLLLMTVSTIESRLEVVLLATMRPNLSNTMRESLFKNYGPLSSFSAKIDLAYAWEKIDEETRDDLRVLKEIRNQFAHSPMLRHVNDAEMEKLFRKFKGYKKESTKSNSCEPRYCGLRRSYGTATQS